MLLYNTKSPGNVQYLGNTHKYYSNHIKYHLIHHIVLITWSYMLMMIEACNWSYMLQYDMDNDLLDHILFNMILIIWYDDDIW